MSKWKWLALAATLYLIFFIMMLPAQFGLWLVDVPKGLQVTGVSGSFWNGRANRVSWNGRTVDDVFWTVNPGSMFAGTLELDVVAGQSSMSNIKLDGTVGASSSGWFVNNLEFEMPANVASEFAPVQLQLRLGGYVVGKIATASQGEPWCEQLDGKLTWVKPTVASTSVSNPLKLDDTRANLSCNAGNVVADVSDDGRVLGLDVKGTLAEGQFIVDGSLKPGREFPQSLEQMLRFVATPKGDGSYLINLDGPL
ncbi:type II secretion system protein N [Echinimonas agarilytica]|uniref:Type II secretion system protein N n=1 Tax=Echinimonas agarilytica TaxID=1215918 RepID=A0AA41W8F1_9GAMM|nr:type II secretion system protein N [Echinimonas agarilytica]MCM2680884.1 type II secretion system protein N [Echinimonas agarilytica]